jgi:hypothetical protein
VQAISAILDNPRCTGYEFLHPYSVRRHPGLPPEAYQIFVRSDRPAHPALVAIDDFLAVATMRSRPTRPRPSRTKPRGADSAAPDQLRHLRSHPERLVQGRASPVPMPTDARRPGRLGTDHPVYLAESRVLAAIAPWLRQRSETCSRAPGWSALHAMLDAVNLRLACDPETDSICATTAVGPKLAMTLIGN